MSDKKLNNPFGTLKISGFKSSTTESSNLVYSDDPKDKGIIDGSLKKSQEQQKNQEQVEKNKFVAVFRIESNGRGGKTVTVLDKLPQEENFLKELTKEFKIKCGVGGSYKTENGFGQIEIQGDKRDQMKKILEQKGINFKGM